MSTNTQALLTLIGCGICIVIAYYLDNKDKGAWL